MGDDSHQEVEWSPEEEVYCLRLTTEKKTLTNYRWLEIHVKNHAILASEYLLIGATIWKPYTCPKMTHHILITLIPLIAVMALGGTFVSIIRLVFWIKEKHKNNRTTTSVPKKSKTKLVFHKNNYHAKIIWTTKTAERNRTERSLTIGTIPTVHQNGKCSFYITIYVKHFNLCATSSILTHVHFLECNTQTLPANSLGFAGSWWKLDKVVPVLKFTSGEEWRRGLWSLSGALFANGFWPWGAWSWSVAMETPLIGMNPSLLLTGEKCDFIKLTAMSTTVPTRQRNRITPHKTLQYKMIMDCKGQLSPRTSLAMNRIRIADTASAWLIAN